LLDNEVQIAGSGTGWRRSRQYEKLSDIGAWNASPEWIGRRLVRHLR
jgi:hypothetical protein